MTADALKGRVLLVVGGGVAAYQVATRMRELAPEMQVVMCSSAGEPPVSSCGMPWAIGGAYPLEKVILKEPAWFGKAGIDLLLNTTVDAVDVERGEAVLKGAGGTARERFDFLALATGRIPVVPPIPGAGLPGAFTLSSYSDAVRIRSALSEARRVTVVGAGPIGLELAGALPRDRYEVSVVEAAASVLPGALDPDMAAPVQRHMSKVLARLAVGARLEAVEGAKRAESVRVAGVQEGPGGWPADLVVFATGMRPNTALGKAAGLDVGPTGGLATDVGQRCLKGGRLLPHVFAVGDCVEVRDGVTGQPRLSQIASTALVQARVACANLCGGNASVPGVVSPQVTSLPGLNAGGVGLTSQRAQQAGLDVEAAAGEAKSRAGYFPGAGTARAKLTFAGGKLVGAQLVSPGEVHGTLDLLGQAILRGMGAEDLLGMERAFSPPLCMLEDAVAKAAAALAAAR